MAFHDLGVGRLLVIIPYKVQKPMHHEVRGVMFEPFTLKLCLFDNGFRRERDIPEEARLARSGYRRKGKHVRGARLVAELLVEFGHGSIVPQ